MEETTPNPLLAALHLHIQGISQRPIDARMLLELEKTCLLARELLAIGKAPDALRKSAMLSDPMSLYESGVGSGVVMASGNYMAQPAYSTPTETFGVQAIRELVNALASLAPKPAEPAEVRMSFTDAVTAIQLAKDAGDLGLADQLRAALDTELGKPATPPPVIDTELASAGPN